MAPRRLPPTGGSSRYDPAQGNHFTPVGPGPQAAGATIGGGKANPPLRQMSGGSYNPVGASPTPKPPQPGTGRGSFFTGRGSASSSPGSLAGGPKPPSGGRNRLPGGRGRKSGPPSLGGGRIKRR